MTRPTLPRFDATCDGLFKANLHRNADVLILSTHMGHVLRLPAMQETVSIGQIKAGHSWINALNPTGIVATGPAHITALKERTT